MLTGTYTTAGQISHRILDVLPTVIVLRETDWDSLLVALLADEMGKNDVGQDVVLDRLLDLLVVAALRAWLSTEHGQTPQWYAAHRDPVVGHAMRLIHNNPAHAWSVANLAATVGVSRATFARRFHELVGEPPISYLTRWRLNLAADLLQDPDATVGSVSRAVGYISPFTFSSSFKRHHGLSPKRHRSLFADASPRAFAPGSQSNES